MMGCQTSPSFQTGLLQQREQAWSSLAMWPMNRLQVPHLHRSVLATLGPGILHFRIILPWPWRWRRVSPLAHLWEPATMYRARRL